MTQFQVTLPASVTALSAATAAAVLTIWDEQVAFPGGRLLAGSGVNWLAFSVRHDQTFTSRLDFKLTASASYTQGTAVTHTASGTPIETEVAHLVEGFPYSRLVVTIGGTNQGVWVPALGFAQGDRAPTTDEEEPEPEPEVLRITFGPVGDLITDASNEELAIRSEILHPLYGAFITLPDTHYIWWTKAHPVSGATLGVDPGNTVAALSGLTGIRVNLAAGQLTGTQVATTTETAVDGAGFDVTRTGAQLDIEVPEDATTFETGETWLSTREVATDSRHGSKAPDAFVSGSFGVDSVVDGYALDNFPTPPYEIVGWGVFVGADATGTHYAALYNGGTSNVNPNNATLFAELPDIEPASANAWNYVYFDAEDVVLVDSDPGRLYLFTSGEGATTTVVGNNADAADDYEVAGGIIVTATNVGTPATWPATMGSGTNPFAFTVPFRLLIRRQPAFGAGTWITYMGPKPEKTDLEIWDQLNNVSDAETLFVGCAYTTPDLNGMTLGPAALHLDPHTGEDQARLHLWECNPAAGPTFVDFDGDVLVHDYGATTGAVAGWVERTITLGSVAIDGDTVYRIVLQSDTGGSEVRFRSGNPDGRDFWPGLIFGSEAESNGGPLAVGSATPPASPVAPEPGELTNPGNSVGLYFRLDLTTFTVVANP